MIAIDEAAKGDLAFASRMLAARSVALDNIFSAMTRRAALNMGEYLAATETYARIAMKAQAGSRATIEAFGKLHQPREQTVRHVQVNEGRQAVIADQFHNHTGGQANAKSGNQPMQPKPARLAQASRSLARTRSGTECRSPAAKGKVRCRMHGGKGSGAPIGNRNARTHGGYSAETKAAARFIKSIGRLVQSDLLD